VQNGIEKILKENSLIPVVTIANQEELDNIYLGLKEKGVFVVEITLRTDFVWEAIQLFKEKYGHEFCVGVGTIVSREQIQKCVDLKVDFMISPGLTTTLAESFHQSGIPFLAGVATPSEIIKGMELGCEYFKFFPAELFGGLKALKAYKSIFGNVKFCPTGGVNEDNYQEYLALDNVLAVGGSWLTKK